MSISKRKAKKLVQEGPVAILGWGVSARAAAALLNKLDVVYDVFDESDCRLTRAHYDDHEATRYPVVVYSPGFPETHEWVKRARKEASLCITELDFAALYFEGRVIAVTGTNGKTTFTSLMTHALRNAGIDAVAVGNIGFPLSRLMAHGTHTEAKTAVCEVSSFQAESLKYYECDAMIWTNFAPDHLDRYEGEQTYFQAKHGLFDCLRSTKAYVGSSVASAAQQLGCSLPDYAQIVEPDTYAEFGEMPKHPGMRENEALLCACWNDMGYSNKLSFAQAIEHFSPPDYRCQLTATLEGVKLWNDAKSTNLAATVSALQQFSEPVLWIGGGQSKGEAIHDSMDFVARKIAGASLLGDTAMILREALRHRGVDAACNDSLEEALMSCLDHAQRVGNIHHILFSPGFASFDQYRDYQQRGAEFEELVLALKIKERQSMVEGEPITDISGFRYSKTHAHPTPITVNTKEDL